MSNLFLTMADPKSKSDDTDENLWLALFFLIPFQCLLISQVYFWADIYTKVLPLALSR